MLTATQLARMQERQNQTLTEAATIKRKSRTPDGAGGSEIDETGIETTCRVADDPLIRPESVVAAKLQGAMPWRFTFPAETDVREDDEVVVGSRRFAVVQVRGPKTRETARVTVCMEI